MPLAGSVEAVPYIRIRPGFLFSAVAYGVTFSKLHGHFEHHDSYHDTPIGKMLSNIFIDSAGRINLISPLYKIESRVHWFGSKYYSKVCMLNLLLLVLLLVNIGI